MTERSNNPPTDYRAMYAKIKRATHGIKQQEQLTLNKSIKIVPGTIDGISAIDTKSKNETKRQPSNETLLKILGKHSVSENTTEKVGKAIEALAREVEQQRKFEP